MNEDRSAEIEGLVDLGAKQQALNLAEEVFNSDTPTVQEFIAAVRAITVIDYTKAGDEYVFNHAKWRGPVTESIARMPESVRSALRPTMLHFYSDCGDDAAAADFFDDDYSDPSDLASALRLASRLGEERLSRRYSELAEVALPSIEDRFSHDALSDALVQFHSSTGDWEKVIRYSDHIEMLDVFNWSAAVIPVEALLRWASSTIEERLRRLDEFASATPTDTDLSLPKYSNAQLAAARQALLRYQQQLRQIVNASDDRQAYGGD